MKSMLQRIAYLTICAVLVVGIFNALSARTVRAEEDGTNYQEVEPGTSVNENTTNEDKKDDWSDFFNNEENRQTEESLDNSSDLTEEQQNESNNLAGAVSQDKTTYSPEEETEDEEQDNPVTYEYKVIRKDCNGNVVSEEIVQSEQPHDDVIIEATGCTIPTDPKPRPTNDVPPTSTTETVKVYDNTPAAPWYVYLAAAVVVVGIAFCVVKPFLAKKAVKQH